MATLAKKRRKVKVEYDSGITADTIPDVIEVSPSRLALATRHTGDIPPRRTYYFRNNPLYRRYEAIVDEDDLHNEQLYRKVVYEEFESHRDRNYGFPPNLWREQFPSPCIKRKSARRAAAFRSGAAGTGKRPVRGRRRYDC